MGNRIKESEELKKYVDRAYAQLKQGIYKASTKPSRGIFECPFCREKKGQDYMYDELMEHARRRGKGSKEMGLKHQGQHVALAEYLAKYHRAKAPPPPPPPPPSPPLPLPPPPPPPPPPPSSREEMKVRCGSSSKPDGRQDDHREQDRNKKYVFPWKGVLVNVPVEFKGGRRVGESGTKLKTQLLEQKITVTSVTPLWTREGHSGCCVVNFSSDWVGFGNAMKFDKAFDVDHRGKTDWNMVRSRGDKLYGWVATEEDYYSKSVLGNHLLQNFNLKSIQDVEAEEERKNTKLLAQLQSTIENKDLECKFMQRKLKATSFFIRIAMEESDEMVERHNSEMSELHRKKHEDMESMRMEHERIKKQLESKKKQLKLREKELEKREFRNEKESRELARRQRANELAQEVQKKVDENMLKLAEEHKKEKEELHEKLIHLEKELEQKQALELEVERMRGAMNVMQHMGGDEDVDVKKKMEDLAKQLEEKEEELADVDELKQALIIKEHKASEELQEAMSALITGFQIGATKGARPTIGVKNIGELAGKPFEVAAKSKYPAAVASEKATEWWSLWEAYLRDSSWHPFKHISEGETDKEVINEEDERLQELKNELGEGPYDAVVTALTEMNEYSPHDRTPQLVLWNNKTQERSNLREGVIFLINKWKQAKKR